MCFPCPQEYADFIKQVEVDSAAPHFCIHALRLRWFFPVFSCPQEYADFIKQVEVDSAAAAQQQAAEEEEEATGRREREDFEQL